MSGTRAKRPPDPFADPVATALVDVVAECGYEAASVEAVLERAGVSRAEFDARFAGKEDCVQKCFEAFAADFDFKVRAAYASQPTWPDNLRAAAYAAGRWFDLHPDTTRFGNVDVLAARNEMVRVRREELFQAHAALIDAGREVAPDPGAVPAAAALMAIGAVGQMLTGRIGSGQGLETERMVPELMYAAVKPYLGEEAARRELTAPPPELPPEAR
jgi:AcrR family transcriptional regulator